MRKSALCDFITVYLHFKCEYSHDEILALKLASDEHIAEIVQFYGAKLTGRNARIFMEFVAGKHYPRWLKVSRRVQAF